MKREILIEAQSGAAFEVKRGELFCVIDVLGGQVADLYAAAADDENEFLSPGVTIDCNNSLGLCAGDRIYSNLYNTLLTVISDNVGVHDLLHPCCRPEMYDFFYKNGSGHKSCFGNINAVIGERGMKRLNIIQPLNLFMNTEVTPDGKLTVKPPVSKPGEGITFRAEADLTVAVAACSVEESSCNSGKCTPIKIVIE